MAMCLAAILAARLAARSCLCFSVNMATSYLTGGVYRLPQVAHFTLPSCQTRLSALRSRHFGQASFSATSPSAWASTRTPPLMRFQPQSLPQAAGVDDPESIDVDYVRDAINAQVDELVAEADACPECGERGADNLVWQDDGKVKCTKCGTLYEPPTK